MRESAAQIAEIAPPGAVRARASGWLAVAARDGLSTLQRALDSAESSMAIRVMVWFSLASAYTFFVVNYSLSHGKMLIYPTYDDVEYLLDGLRRLEVFQSEGLVSGLLNLIGNPPHSPYSTLVATAGFALVGAKDWAPYAGSGIAILLLLGLVDRFMNGLRLWQRLLIYVLVCTYPLTVKAVYEYRPDFISALFCASGIVWLLRGPMIRASAGQRLIGGVLFGLAILTKPVAFPFTSVMLFCTLSLVTLCDFIDGDRRFETRKAIRSLLLVLLPVLLIAGPYLLLTAGDLARYIQVTLGESGRGNWSLQSDPLTQARYFLDGEGGHAMLDRHLYLIVATLLVGLGSVFFVRDAAATRAGAALGSMILLAYLIPTLTLSRHKSTFFALTFQVLLVLLSLLVVKRLLLFEAGKRLRIPWASGLLVLSVVAGMFFWRWPDKWRDDKDPTIVRRNRIARDVYAALPADAAAPQRVLFTTTGWVNSELFNYVALRQHAPLTFFSVAESGQLEDVEMALNEADVVVASEPGNSEVATNFQSARIQSEVLRMLQARSDFQSTATVSTFGPGAYVVLKKVAASGP